ncbi:MAG: phosphonate ABC transporter, permease protein PhnE [Chloroflexi bacterium]|nr:phosphonate ABC transporter, permease protein PhnE [Chloroflexota bacterium]
MVAPEGYQVYYSVPHLEGQMVVAKRYVLEPGEAIIGYPVIIDAIIETVQIAIVGTLGAVLISMPFALLAARNISPHPIVYMITRVFLNVNRSIPTLIWALIMVSAVGLGPFAGIMALFVASIGSTARLYAESFEQIDPNQVAAVRATGAGPLQVFNFGVLPQAFPLLATYSLISFEGNVRESTILGIVGAGGVGFVIQKYTALFQFNRLMGAVIIIAIMVTIIDRVSDTIRKRII